MSVSDADIKLVVDSLPHIRERLVPASTAFYDNLFTLAPELRTMFRSDLAGQGMRFMSTLATIADLLAEPEALGPELDDLAAAHAGLGVKAAHFVPMRSALMVTLGEVLGPDFTPELQSAWHAAFDHFAQQMIARGNFE